MIEILFQIPCKVNPSSTAFVFPGYLYLSPSCFVLLFDFWVFRAQRNIYLCFKWKGDCQIKLQLTLWQKMWRATQQWLHIHGKSTTSFHSLSCDINNLKNVLQKISHNIDEDQMNQFYFELKISFDSSDNFKGEMIGLSRTFLWQIFGVISIQIWNTQLFFGVEQTLYILGL